MIVFVGDNLIVIIIIVASLEIKTWGPIYEREGREQLIMFLKTAIKINSVVVVSLCDIVSNWKGQNDQSRTLGQKAAPAHSVKINNGAALH